MPSIVWFVFCLTIPQCWCQSSLPFIIRNKMVKIFPGPVDYNGAVDVCTKNGGRPLVIDNHVVFNILIKTKGAGLDIWVNGRESDGAKETKNPQLVLHDGKKAPRFYNQEFSKENDPQKCVTVVSNLMLRRSCKETRGVACERPWAHADIAENVVPGKAIGVIKRGRTWNQAQAYCQKKGGNLVTVNDQRIADWMTNRKQRLWIGYTDQNTEGEWKWASGEKTTFVKWNPGEPNNHGNNEDCALNGPSGNWLDAPCNGRKEWSICEIKVEWPSETLRT